MTARSARLGKVSRSLVILLALLAAHLALAPFTASRMRDVKTSAAAWWAHRSSAAHMAALRSRTASPPEAFAACAVAFRDYLTEKGIKLVVVVVPDRSDVQTDDGWPQTKTSDLGVATWQAAQALRRAKVKVVDSLPVLHEMATLDPVPPPADDAHLTDKMSGKIGELVAASLPRETISRNGRHVLLTGDCYALRVGEQLRRGGSLESARVIWRNGASEKMPYELVQLPEKELEGIKHIVWFVSGPCLIARVDQRAFPPLADAMVRRADGLTGEKTVNATLTRSTTVPKTLGAETPYPDCLVLHEFRADDGEEFLGLVKVMTAHKVHEAVRVWGNGTKLLLTMIPWESAMSADPRLSHIQILDESSDFTHPRRLITRWLHAP